MYVYKCLCVVTDIVYIAKSIECMVGCLSDYIYCLRYVLYFVALGPL